MKKFIVFIICAASLSACVSKKQYVAFQNTCQIDKDSLRNALTICMREYNSLLDRNDNLFKETIALREDSTTKNNQISTLKRQNLEFKELNENLTSKQNKMTQQSIAESKKMMEELQQSREQLQKREDALDSIKLSLDAERLALNKIRKELGIKDGEILNKNKKIADMEEMLRRKDSASIALKNKIQKALIGFEGQGLTIEQRNGKIYVLLDEALLFKVGQSVVADKGQDALKKLAAVLEQNQDINITIEGHTDNTGGEKINWELSAKRSLAISYILQDNSKINGKRITVAGRGQFAPIDKANTTEARAKNRRSEIILTPDLEELYEIINK